MKEVACNLCGSRDHRLIFVGRDLSFGSEGAFPVVQCQRCGLRFLNPQPDSSEVVYPDGYYATPDPRNRGRLRRLLGCLPAYRRSDPRMLPPGRLLDVGCGTGEFLVRMRRLGWETWGIEPNGHAAAMAQRTGSVILNRPAEGGPPQDMTFDVIRFSHVLEHLMDPKRMLAAYRSSLSPKGEIILVVPDASCLQARFFGPRWFQYEIPRHYFHFDGPTLKALVEAAGYRCVKVARYFLPFMFIPNLRRWPGWRCSIGLPGLVLAAPWWGLLGLADEIVVRATS